MISRSILVCHSRLHNFLKALAFVCQLVHHIVFLLQSVLKIIDHSLFNLLKLLDALFVGGTNAFMLGCLHLMVVRYVVIVGFTVEFFVLFRVATDVQ